MVPEEPSGGREPSVDNDVLLREHGLRITAQRLAVLRAVAERPHCTADDIDDVVRAEIGAIPRQAVYDGARGLRRDGRLRRIQPAGSPARYETLVRATTTTTSSAERATGWRTSTVRSGTRRASRPPTRLAMRSTKPKSSTGASVPSVSKHQKQQ